MIHGRTRSLLLRANAIEPLRKRHRFLKIVAVIVTTAFLGLTLQPLAIAARLPDAPKRNPIPAAPSNEERLSHHLDTLKDRLDRYERKLDKRENTRTEQQELKTLRTELDQQDREALADFDRIGQHIKDKHLPPVIQQRHDEAVKQYKKEMAALKANLDDVDQAKDDTTRKGRLKKAKDHLKAKHPGKRQKTKFDPNDLPNKSLRPNPKNRPKLNKQDFQRAGLYSNPTVQVAALGDFTFDKLPGANDPAYLAETDEVVLTDAIKAKALELNYEPVRIYHFVRNNVEWLPTWGATQDADVTLGSLRGNAMDIASLTIALLRASKIPARYVYGTVELPEDKFRNWAGNFTSIEAAADFAASGGIPVTTITSGGKITKVQMEHVWAEAAIDFFPSRGAINKSADQWIQLDPSYKQYEYLPGLDVISITGTDPNALAQSFASSGTVNETEGWVQNLNPAILQTAQTDAQTKLQTYIQNNLTNPTVGDVIGGRKIIADNSTILDAVPPLPVKTRGASYGKLPQGLQHTMTLAFGTDPTGEPVNPVTFPWAKLNNHKVTLSFKPATSADEQTLQSLLPTGEITDPSQLPSSIPAYLITVIPEIAVDGQVVGQGNAMTLGTDLNLQYGINRVNGQGSHTSSYSLAAGSYVSIAVAGGSTSANALNSLKTKLTNTQTVLQSGNATQIGALTREDLPGDMFYVGTLGYFAEYMTAAHVATQPQKARHSLPAGYGTLGYEPNVQTFFGFPRALTEGGVAVDMHLRWVISALDGDATKRPQLGLQTGMLSSALEHSVPEQMFSRTVQPAQGVSAMKALQIAVSQGQRIYHITAQNQSTTLANLHLDDSAMGEIASALAIGKEVIAHTDRISVTGWIGEGYVLFDPVTGDGAYKIAGGGNGAYLFLGLAGIGLTMFLTAIPLLAAFSPLLFALVAFGELLLFFQAINFSQGIMDIALSDCSDSEKQALASSLSMLHVLEGICASLFRLFGGDANGIRKVLVEVLQLLSVDASFFLFGELAKEMTNNMILRCTKRN